MYFLFINRIFAGLGRSVGNAIKRVFSHEVDVYFDILGFSAGLEIRGKIFLQVSNLFR